MTEGPARDSDAVPEAGAAELPGSIPPAAVAVAEPRGRRAPRLIGRALLFAVRAAGWLIVGLLLLLVVICLTRVEYTLEDRLKLSALFLGLTLPVLFLLWWTRQSRNPDVPPPGSWRRLSQPLRRVPAFALRTVGWLFVGACGVVAFRGFRTAGAEPLFEYSMSAAFAVLALAGLFGLWWFRRREPDRFLAGAAWLAGLIAASLVWLRTAPW